VNVPQGSIRLLVVGDLHGRFDEADRAFLEGEETSAILFVGDLGDEDPGIAQRVAGLRGPKHVILGNHDAWESFRLDRPTSALRRTLEVLGPSHAAYDLRGIFGSDYDILGVRPFSWGGPKLRSPAVYEELYGLSSMEESASRIVEVGRRSRTGKLIVLAHNGPRGLGKETSDIFGKDFGRPGGDWGDEDLHSALRTLEHEGFEIPLVVAGHMHHRLHHPRGGLRRRCVRRGRTIFVNAARVPRIYPGPDGKTHHHAMEILVGEDGQPVIRDLVFDRNGLLDGTTLRPLPLDRSTRKPAEEEEGDSRPEAP